MAIKKAFYGRQPGRFCLRFSLSPLAVTRELFISFVSEIFNKEPSFTYFGFEKLLFIFGEFSACTKSVHGLIFNFLFVTPIAL